ncbi:MAG: hypothetical protein VYD61_02005, partial [SAR324 cluster bacterium]|nr:hypothetical protein [SAR324 cluster bacterium]
MSIIFIQELNNILSMNNFRFFYNNILSVVGCIVVLISIDISILQAEIINRSRPEPEIRER